LTLADEVKLWVAVIAASASLIGVIFSHFSNRANQAFIERLKSLHSQEDAEKNAKRDYEYDARKRLYEQCGPILFQLVELSESAYFRIIGLAENAKNGNLELGSSHLEDSYYRLSTLYRILAPSAALKILQTRLTLVDFSLDKTIWRQYTLARQVFFTFGGEFQLAKIEPVRPYYPFDRDAEKKAKHDPAQFYRQGLPIGVMEVAIESLVRTTEGNDLRLISYAECEAEYEREGSALRHQFDEIAFLIEGFHPRSRPIFWRMLVTQASLHRALYQQTDFDSREWSVANLQIPETEWPKFDWRSRKDPNVSEEAALEPLRVAQTFLNDRLGVRLDRITKQQSS
jgi:hypothetical protein